LALRELLATAPFAALFHRGRVMSVDRLLDATGVAELLNVPVSSAPTGSEPAVA